MRPANGFHNIGPAVLSSSPGKALPESMPASHTAM
jgi:hypothetical protein